MDTNRKYFGMTVPQLGVLAGLAGALCLILCVAGYLIFGSGLSLAGQQPVSPNVVNPTATLILPPTVTPTFAPTAIPYEQLIPVGWKQHRTDLIEIWAPPEYKTSKLPEGMAFEANTALSISHLASKSELYNKRILVFYEPLTADSLDAFLDMKIQALDPTIRIVDRRKVNLNGLDAIRLTAEARVDNIDVNELAFVIQDGGTVWYVEYVAQIIDYFELLPMFEQSILTFRVVR